MKKTLLERKLKELGWWKKREGGNHEIWTNGYKSLTVPRHNEVAEVLALAILQSAAASQKLTRPKRTH